MRLLLAAVALSVSLCAPVSANSGQATAATDPDQAIKCRKIEVTGSFIKKGKVCKTIAEWKIIQENGNRTARAVWDQGAKPTNGLQTNP